VNPDLPKIVGYVAGENATIADHSEYADTATLFGNQVCGNATQDFKVSSLMYLGEQSCAVVVWAKIRSDRRKLRCPAASQEPIGIEDRPFRQQEPAPELDWIGLLRLCHCLRSSAPTFGLQFRRKWKYDMFLFRGGSETGYVSDVLGWFCVPQFVVSLSEDDHQRVRPWSFSEQ
jgi:hypothetical protein